MKQNLEKYLKDCSTPKEFQFLIRCESCGSIWKSKPILFSYADVNPVTEGKRIIYQTLYKREKETALELAVNEAREVFSLCPICSRLVCDCCFLLCDEIEMCNDCASKLQEPGIPVVYEKEDLK